MRPSLLPVPVTAPTEKHRQSSRTFQGIPGLAVAANGRLFAVWYSGGCGECGDNYVLVCLSEDQGATWTDAVAVVDPSHPQARAFDATLWTAPDNRLFLFWAQGMSSQEHDIFDGKAGVWYAVLENPDAAPQDFRWSAPVRICDGIMMNKPTVLGDGTWALPISVWNCGAHPGTEDNIGTKMWVSDDQGETFHERGRCRLPKDISTFDEHSFVELTDGRVRAVIRVTYGTAEAFSSDKGMSWSAAQPSNIPGPCSRVFIRRLQSGKTLLVAHDCPPTTDGTPIKRERLSAWLSDDDGKTWYGRLMLDERNTVSYPDGDQAPDGTIYLIHDFGRYDGGEIIVDKITEADIAAGKLVTPSSRLGTRISKSNPVIRETK